MKKTLLTGALAAAFSVGMVLPAAAAELSNGAGESCDGLAVWHFVNNQTRGAAPGTLSAVFTVDGNTTTYAGVIGNVSANNQQFEVVTDGSATLVSATTNLPGRLVLSDVTCDGGGKKEDPKK